MEINQVNVTKLLREIGRYFCCFGVLNKNYFFVFLGVNTLDCKELNIKRGCTATSSDGMIKIEEMIRLANPPSQPVNCKLFRRAFRNCKPDSKPVIADRTAK